ncbi:radical SAM-linked protein [Austwickia chelonae]|nr:radical SAM-linked protein [Austwickia chelonae]
MSEAGREDGVVAESLFGTCGLPVSVCRALTLVFMARQRVPSGPPAAPPVQRLRLRYAKRGRLRFSSTRDFQRALERALRRAAVPMAFSSGFHPHPRISYANAAPTGTASEAEYVEIALAEKVDLGAVRTALDDALPPGLDVLAIAESTSSSLADLLQASDWMMCFPELDPAELGAVRAEFLGLDEAPVTRMFKSGEKTLDPRSAVVSMAVFGPDDGCAVDSTISGLDGGYAILRMVVRHTTPAVRPDDILTALRTYASLSPISTPLVIRLAQGPLIEGEVADPLAAPQ